MGILFCSCKPYVPGDPGAKWTRRDVIAVRMHLQWIIKNSKQALFKVGEGPVSALEGKVENWQNVNGNQIFQRYFRRVRETPPGIREQGGPSPSDSLLPNIGKLVRLSFHDCIKDSETGGCNGCLNFDRMGVESRGKKFEGCQKDQTCEQDSLPKRTDNNNLLWVARVLEIL